MGSVFSPNIFPRGCDLQINDPRISGTPFQQSYWLMASDNFSAWMQPQIDQAKTLGANAISTILDTGNIVSGRYVSQDIFIARVEAVADYCALQGLYYFPVLTNGVETGDEANLTLIAPLVGQVVAALATRPNVIGYDLWAEIQGNINAGQFDSATAQSLLLAQRTAVLNEHVLPCGVSVIVFASGDWTSSVWSLVSAYCDFWLCHLYQYIAASTDPNSLMTTYGQKPLLIGETGGTTAEGSTFQTNIYNAAAGVGARSDCVGLFQWSLCDGPDSSGYGLVSGTPGSFAARTQMTVPFAAWPGSRLMPVVTPIGNSPTPRGWLPK